MTVELWVQDRMKIQEYMHMLQETEVEEQIMVEILTEKNGEIQSKKTEYLVKL